MKFEILNPSIKVHRDNDGRGRTYYYEISFDFKLPNIFKLLDKNTYLIFNYFDENNNLIDYSERKLEFVLETSEFKFNFFDYEFSKIKKIEIIYDEL